MREMSQPLLSWLREAPLSPSLEEQSSALSWDLEHSSVQPFSFCLLSLLVFFSHLEPFYTLNSYSDATEVVLWSRFLND